MVFKTDAVLCFGVVFPQKLTHPGENSELTNGPFGENFLISEKTVFTFLPVKTEKNITNFFKVEKIRPENIT